MLRAWRLSVLVATAAASRTAGTWPPGTGSSGRSVGGGNKQAPLGPFFSAAEAAAAAPSPSLQHPRSLIPGRRRGPGRHSCAGRRGSWCCSGGTRGDGDDECTQQPSVPLWVRARGGAAGKQVSGGRPPLSEEGDEEADDGLESEEEGLGNEDAEEAAADDEDEDEDEVETDENVDGSEGGSDSAGTGATAAVGAAAPGAAAGAAEEPSVLGMLDVKTVLPQAIKTGAFFVVARWLGNKLTPTVESHVRAARMIYTVYLILSQALCMYIRWGVARSVVLACYWRNYVRALAFVCMCVLVAGPRNTPPPPPVSIISSGWGAQRSSRRIGRD